MGKKLCVAGDGAESLRSVIYGVHSAHCCHKGGCGTYIGCGLLSLDMLLSCLEGKPYCAVSKTVNGYAYDSSRNASLVFLPGCEISCGRSAESHRESEPLGASYCNVGSPGCRLLEDCKGQDVAVCGYHCPGLVHPGAECRIVSDLSVGGRVLDQCAKAHRIRLPSLPVAEDNLDSKAFCPSADNAFNLREHFVIHKEHILSGLLGIAASEVEHYSHCLSGSLGVVQHGAVGKGESGKGADDCLVDQKSLKSSL